MTFYRSLSALFVPVCWVVLSVAEDLNAPVSTAVPRTAVTKSSGVNSTGSGGKGPTEDFLDPSTIRRALYVLIGITIIGVLYFLIRAIRSMKKPAHKKKYGLLSSYDDAVEMEAVESDEDDTVYEARSLRR